jgi:putative transposase
MKKSTCNEAASKFQVVDKKEAAATAQPLFAANPEAVLPLLQMIGKAQLTLEDLLGRMSREFVEQLLVMSAQSIAGEKHPGRSTGPIRWHGQQSGSVHIGNGKLKVTRPRLRNNEGEIALPGYAALSKDSALSQRIADILLCGISTRKYSRAIYQSADAMGVSKSAVSRHFVKDSAHALSKLMSRDLGQSDWVAIYVDGLIIAKHHVLAAVGVDANGDKQVLGLASGSSENAKVVKDLLSSLEDRGVDLNQPRLWIIDGSKALRAAIDQKCGEAAHVQRCRLHKLRNVVERLPKAKAETTRWVMMQAMKGDAAKGIAKLKDHARHLKAAYPDAAASLLEGLDELFTINRLGVGPELARCLATTNIIESPNSTVRRVGKQVTRYRDAAMTLRWAAAGFLEAEKSFRKIHGYKQLGALVKAMRPVPSKSKRAA